jgi:hypothetical protein
MKFVGLTEEWTRKLVLFGSDEELVNIRKKLLSYSCKNCSLWRKAFTAMSTDLN